MPIADSSRAALRYIEEITAGITPVGPLNDLRFTSESLNQSISYETSNEIRPDRQITNTIRTGSEPAGDVGFELSYDSLDQLIPGAMFSDWSTPLAISLADVSVDGVGNTYDSVGGDFVALGIVAGQYINVGGFATAINNGIVRVVSVTSLQIVVIGKALVTEAAGATITVGGSYIRNGIQRHYYTLEKQFSDITQFHAYRGMEVSSFGLEIPNDNIITGTMNFMGLSATSATVTAGTGSPIPAPANDIFNGVSNVTQVFENDIDMIASGNCPYSLNFNIDNALRMQRCIGTDGPTGIGVGRVAVTGNLGVWFRDEVLYEKMLNSTESSLAWIVNDNTGNTYVISFPRIRFVSGNPEASGIDTDIGIDFDFTAYRHETLGYTVQIDKIV